MGATTGKHWTAATAAVAGLPRARGRGRRGFTLIESAITMVIVGVGTLSLLQLLAAGTVSNSECSELMVGLHLANDIREMSRGMKFADPTTPTHWGLESGETAVAHWDDVDDLDGQTIWPPVDARKQTLNRYARWKQRVTVETVMPGDVATTTTKGSQPVHRVTVSVLKDDQEVCHVSWLRCLPPKG